MKSEIRIQNTAEACRIEIEGTIGIPEEWQFDAPDERVATYERFRDTVARIGSLEAQRIVVDIRSTGGDVNDALLIHDALRQTGAHITTRCYGYTASAATLIAQAASEGCREISANALYLIHTAVCATEGNAAELAGKTDLLRQTDARIAALYAVRSGRPAAEFEALMAENNGSGRWLSPDEAVAAGLADRVIPAAETPAAGTPAADTLAADTLAADTPAGGTPAGETPAAAAPVEKTAPVRNLVRGWERLLAAIGRREKRSGLRDETCPADRNILRIGEDERARRLAAASETSRRRAAATRTRPVEDPSYGDAVRTANEKAYAEDARRFGMHDTGR